jgi:hypothetical protein
LGDLEREVPPKVVPMCIAKKYIKQAETAIKFDKPIAYNVALQNGQILDNVKHMGWFVDTLADQLRYDDATHKKPTP